MVRYSLSRSGIGMDIKKSILALLFLLFVPVHATAEVTPEVFVQVESRLGIYATALSPDGKYALSGGLGNNLKLWDIASGREIRTLLGYSEVLTDMVTSVVFSPDGRVAATGMGEGAVKIWEIPSGKEARSLGRHTQMVRSIAFTPDGRRIVSGSLDKTVKVWDIATGKEILAMKGHRLAVRSVAVSPDNTVILSAGDDNTLRVWDAASGREMRTIEGHFNAVTSVAFSPDGRHAASASMDQKVKLWNVKTWEEVKTMVGHARPVECLTFSADGKYIASGSDDLTVRIWDVATGREVRRMVGHADFVTSVQFSPDSRHLLTAAADKLIKYWDAATGKEVRQLRGNASVVKAVATSTGGKAAAAYDDSVVRVWDSMSSRELKRLKSSKDGEFMDVHISTRVTSLGFSRDGSHLVAGTEGGPITIWDAETGREIKSWKGHNDVITSIDFSPDGKYAITGSIDNWVRMWELTSGKEARSFSGQTIGILAAACSSDGRQVISAGVDSRVIIWDVATGRELKNFKPEEKPVLAASISPDGKTVAFSMYDKTVRLVDISAAAATKTLSGSGDVKAIAFSPDGRQLVSGSDDTTVRLWDVGSGKEIWTFRTHKGMVRAVTFMAEGRRIFSGSYDGTTKVIDAARGAEVVQYVSFIDGQWVSSTPEGSFSASQSGARQLNIRVGDSVYSADNLFETYFNPAAVEAALQDREMPGLKDLRKGIATPPVTRITTPAAVTVTAKETVSVTLEAKDTGGGVAGLRLYHNGNLTAAKEPEAGKGEVREVIDVKLLPSDNILKAVGRSRDGTESDPHEITVRRTGGSIESNLFVVLIGISDYRNPALKSVAPVPNVKRLAEYFASTGRGPYVNLSVSQITNGEATKEGISRVLAGLKTDLPDSVLIYFSGQSRHTDGEWYYVTYDVDNPENTEQVKQRGFSSSDIAGALQSLPALRKVTVIDTFEKTAPLSPQQKAIRDSRRMALLSRTTGSHVIAATAGDPDAPEVRHLGLGLFAHSLIEGMKGLAENPGLVPAPLSPESYREKTITVRSLITYLERAYPEAGRKYAGGERSPLVFQGLQDVVLSVVK